MTLSRRDISTLLHDHGLAPRRAFGQNFVADPNTVRRIAHLAGVGPGDRVIEIGAGLGSLTLALLETGASVTAVEVDHGLVAVLRDVVEPAGAVVIAGDAMTLDWESVLGDGPWTLVANLPYNIATPLIIDLLEGVGAIQRMLVMVQAEVGERWVAAPGDDAYGAVSVLIAYWATAAMAGRVPATVFVPRPRVESVLVSLQRRDRPEGVDYPRLKQIVRAGFGKRRKTLRGSLAGVLEPAALEATGIDPGRRAETLSLAEFTSLATWTA